MNNNSGPWGNNDNNQNPWGRRPNNNQNPDVDDLIKQSKDKFKKFIPSKFGGGKSASLIFLILIALWLATGIYRVNPQEQGVVLRFGEWVRTTEPGLHYHLPTPIEKVITPDVTRENKIEIGTRLTIKYLETPTQPKIKVKYIINIKLVSNKLCSFN